jgi:hypothetical protein
MAHILEGRWKSSTKGLTGNTLNPDVPEAGMDPILDLKIDEGTGKILQGSKHGNSDLTGQVSKEGRKFVIEINNLSRNRRYEGVFAAEIQAFGGGAPTLVLAGKLRLNVQFGPDGRPIPAAAATKGTNAPFAQDQEIWVATKP